MLSSYVKRFTLYSGNLIISLMCTCTGQFNFLDSWRSSGQSLSSDRCGRRSSTKANWKKVYNYDDNYINNNNDDNDIANNNDDDSNNYDDDDDDNHHKQQTFDIMIVFL